MRRDIDLSAAIRQRDMHSIVKLFFDPSNFALNTGFRAETELWDFKRECPPPSAPAVEWAEIAKDVMAFHNHRGGILIFGVDDQNFRVCRTDAKIDSKVFNDKIRKYVGDRIWVEFHREFIGEDQSYVGIALVPPRGPNLIRFSANSPEKRGHSIFRKGGSAIRRNDSSVALSKDEAERMADSLSAPSISEAYAVDEPFYRLLSPDYAAFVFRDSPCTAIDDALSDPRTAVASVIGIGGIGKTALGTWAALNAYHGGSFDYIVSMTAKDRELTAHGIRALDPGLTSYEHLLDTVATVLGFPEYSRLETDKKDQAVRSLLSEGRGLLLVDNLETVDDPRIVEFLDHLPVGVKAITTSRRTAVRFSVYPIDLGPLSPRESDSFIRKIAVEPGLAYVHEFSSSDRERVADACDGIPLPIRWVLARSYDRRGALSLAEDLGTVDRRGEELLEFSFRRVFESMNDSEQKALMVLALFQRPIPLEAILVGSGLRQRNVADAIDELVRDAIIERTFDSARNDYVYSVLPITRHFVYEQVLSESGLEQSMRTRLTNWFEAKDVKSKEERLVVREVRQGKGSSETALLDLARAAENRGDDESALELYQQALKRNPTSWEVARSFAEFYRHRLRRLSDALRLYERAAGNAPARGQARSRIFREWGILLRDSGEPRSTEYAIEKLEIAVGEAPNDPIATTALAQLLDRQGRYNRIIELLEPFRDHPQDKTRAYVLPLLKRAYKNTGEIVKAAEIRL